MLANVLGMVTASRPCLRCTCSSVTDHELVTYRVNCDTASEPCSVMPSSVESRGCRAPSSDDDACLVIRLMLAYPACLFSQALWQVSFRLKRLHGFVDSDLSSSLSRATRTAGYGTRQTMIRKQACSAGIQANTIGVTERRLLGAELGAPQHAASLCTTLSCSLPHGLMRRDSKSNIFSIPEPCTRPIVTVHVKSPPMQSNIALHSSAYTYSLSLRSRVSIDVELVVRLPDSE